MTVETPEADLPVAQVTGVVPTGATPGETQLSLPLPSSAPDGKLLCVTFTVPKEASIGDRVIFSKYSAERWSCQVAKGKMEDLVVRIPADAIPAVTVLPIMSPAGWEIMRLKVPEDAKPGVDELRVTQGPDAFDVALLKDPDEPDLVKDMAVGATQAALRAPALPAEVAYAQLVAAVRKAGGYVNEKMARGSAPPLNIPGIIAREPIAEGEELCRIPVSLHVSPLSCQTCLPDFWSGALVQEINSEQRQEEGIVLAFAARLLHEAEDRAVARATGSCLDDAAPEWLRDVDPKVRKVWEAYMDQLLGEEFANHPVRVAGADTQAMKARFASSMISNHLFKEARSMHTMHRITASRVPKEVLGERFEKGMYLRAMLCFHSRQFRAAVSRSLVPIADLLNHASANRRGVAWMYDKDAQAHVLTVLRDHAAGEELLQSYGAHSNACYYRCYGFTELCQEETQWSYSLWREAHPKLYDIFVPQQSIYNKSEVYLSSVELSESVQQVLTEIAGNGRNPAHFLRCICTFCMTPYEEDQKLQPYLATLKSSRASNPSSGQWWTEPAGSEYDTTKDDAIRVQMCEYLCLVAHLEAVALVAGETSDDQCLELATGMRFGLRDLVVALHRQSGHTWAK